MGQLINYNTRKSVYDRVSGYILNPEHKTGWTKGRWFMLALGFNPENPEHVKMPARQIHFDGSRAIFKGIMHYGERYDLFLSITGPNGKTIDGVKTGWQKDHGSNFMRLLTVLPSKRKR